MKQIAIYPCQTNPREDISPEHPAHVVATTTKSSIEQKQKRYTSMAGRGLSVSWIDKV